MANNIPYDDMETINTVQVDGLVIMKMFSHMQSHSTTQISHGVLLGLQTKSGLEVTHCIPSLASKGDEDQKTINDRTVEHMNILRKINIDSNTVGWYMIGDILSQINDVCIKSQFDYQTQIPNTIFLVLDVNSIARGNMGLHAYRLSSKTMKMYAKQAFTKESIQQNRFSSRELFDSLPVSVSQSILNRSFMHSLGKNRTLLSNYSSFVITPSSQSENDVNSLIKSIASLQSEQSKYQFAQRAAARQTLSQQSMKKDQNGNAAVRAVRGVAEPSKLDIILAQNQIAQHCGNICRTEAQNLCNMFAIKAANHAVEASSATKNGKMNALSDEGGAM